MKPVIVLFDVDGTLITTNGAGRRALERLFEDHLGSPDAFEGVPFAGMTDPAILRAGLRATGHADDPGSLESLFEPYLQILEREMATAAGLQVMPGVVEHLETLARIAHVAVGLGTGNIESGARIKLRRVGLEQHFAFGGFGCDHEIRTEVVRAGARRGAERLGQPPEHCRVLVIGDTPKDIAAARGIGAECIAVATGPFSVEELTEHRPDEAIPDLRQSALLKEIVRHDGESNGAGT